MILYFSATGNSQYVAERIAKALGDRAVALDRYSSELKGNELKENEGNEEVFGIVTPVYFWELPIVTREFLQEQVLKVPQGAYVFVITTYGTTPGASGSEAKGLLKKQGISVDGLFGVPMPDTWTPFFNLRNKEKVAAINRAAEKHIDRIIRQIRDRQRGNFQRGRIPDPVRRITDKVYSQMRRTSHLHVEDSCIGCGLCERKCPVGAIQMRNGRPVWVKESCAMCLGCLHRCPKFAIQYDHKTKNHGQYIHDPIRIGGNEAPI